MESIPIVKPRGSRASRRAFLAAAAALAPAAVAAAAAAQETEPPPAPEPAAAADPLKDIREFRVPLGTEPAFVFRALKPAAGEEGGAK